jgi:hypothetical protein
MQFPLPSTPYPLRTYPVPNFTLTGRTIGVESIGQKSSNAPQYADFHEASQRHYAELSCAEFHPKRSIIKARAKHSFTPHKERMTATETTSRGLMLGRPTVCTQLYCGVHDKPADGFIADTTSRTGAHFFVVNNAPNANKKRVTSLNTSNDGGLWQTRLLLWILTVLYDKRYYYCGS